MATIEITVALVVPGIPWGWGENYRGQLGDGTNVDSLHPVAASGLGSAIAVAGGGYHSVALRNDGTVWAWGRNDYGQLGDGATTGSNVPVQVRNAGGPVTSVIALAAGVEQTFALKSDGTVWACGYNRRGRLGDGTTTDRSVLVQVVDSGDPSGFLTGVVAISCGEDHGMALKSDGGVWTWGENYNGALGDGTTTYRTTPVRVTDPNDASGYLTGVTAVEGGGWHSMAQKSDGSVWAWGGNWDGQLGDATTEDRYTPVRVADPSDLTGFLTNVKAVSCGSEYSLALKSDGSVWSWGANYSGELGSGSPGWRPVPGPVSWLSGVLTISAGYYHAFAIGSDRAAWAWGYNYSGQLGDGTTIDRLSPVRVREFSDVQVIAGGLNHSLAVAGPQPPTASDDAYSIAAGGTLNVSAPGVLINDRDLDGDALSAVLVTAPENGSLSLNADGSFTYTPNAGFTGTDTFTYQATDGSLNSNVATVRLAAITLTAGKPWAWGNNDRWQLGDGTDTHRPTPVRVAGLNGVHAKSMGRLSQAQVPNLSASHGHGTRSVDSLAHQDLL